MPVRSGGFGGVAGLVAYIRAEGIDAVIDATHPFAAQISANAVAACREAGVPLASLVRPEWTEVPGDQWVRVRDAASAVEALGREPQRVFLAMGRLEIAAFAAAPQHDYIARMIEEPGDIPLPPRLELVFERPPFTEDHERAFLEAHRIQVIVSKLSGGDDTYAKIAAARAFGLPVIMIERPEKPCGDEIFSADDALRWLSARRP